jgi:hypothetical protein
MKHVASKSKYVHHLLNRSTGPFATLIDGKVICGCLLRVMMIIIR